MDTQKQTEMAHKEIQEETTSRPTDDVTEEQFLKDLYLFMKKRDTPIERIPHLGFKQIDLFMMFKTVKDLGGYHQVTAQQLWKQVYNTLGGNPRSTSAATCTRRHYEKLMLPYECHIKGLRLNAVQQPRTFHYLGYRKEEEDGQLPAKRRAVLFPLQNPPGVMPEQHAGVFPLSPSYHKFYYPPYPYAPLPHSLLPSPRPHAPPQPYLPCPPPISIATERPPPTSEDHIKDPLEHLRYLAKQYQSSTGRVEPLNLSVKASGLDISTNPVSSFAPPSSNKTPKFLNKPSPLYTSQSSSVQSEAEGGMAAPSFFNSLKDSPTQNSAPALSTDTDTIIGQNNKDTTKMATKNSPPKTEERERSPEVNGISDLLSSSTAKNGGRMEIEIPLSVFNNWLQMYGPQAALHGSRQLLVQESTGKSTVAETVPANLTFEIKQKETERRPEEEDLRQNPTPATGRYDPNQYNFNNSKHLPSCGILKNAVTRDVYSYIHSDVNKPYNHKGVPPDCWELTNRGGPTFSKQVNGNSSPPTVQQDFRAPKPNAVNMEVGQQQPGAEVLMLKPSSLLQLTPEEVMKLKKIISNSA